MPIINRTLDTSEQRKVLAQQFALLATGVTSAIALIPYPCVLERAQIAAVGISGTPTYTLAVNRFIPGAGFTTWAVSAANTPPVFGTSGVLAAGFSILASGSSLLNLQANDYITMTSGGANSASLASAVGIVVRPVQDVKINFGLI